MALATLSIDIIAKLASLQEGLDKAGRMSEKSAAQIDAKFAGLKNGAVALGAALGAAFSVGAIESWFLATAEGIEKLKDLKDATGASVENISALEDVALRTGNSFESMATTLVKFNKVLIDSKQGSDVAEILKSIGLNAEELKRIDPAEALHRTAKALGDFADDGSKARAVQVLFGKSVQEVAPFLKELAEQGKLNAKVTTEQAKAAEEFNHQLASLHKNSIDFARSIVSDIVPALNKYLENLKQIGGVSGAAKDLFGMSDRGKLVSQASAISAAMKSETDSIALMTKKLETKGGMNDDFLKTRIEKARAHLKELSIQADETSAKLKGFADAASPQDGSYDALEARRLSKRATIGDIPEKPTKAGIDKPAIDEVGLDRLEALKNSLKQQADANDAAASAMEAAQKKMDGLIASTPSEKLKESKANLDLLAEAFDNGSISATQFIEASQMVSVKLPVEFKAAADDMSKFAEEAARNIQGALGDTIYDTLTGKFDDIGARWMNLLNRMASEALAAQIGKTLFGDFAKTGSIGGLLGGLFSGAGGSGGGLGAGAGTAEGMAPFALGAAFDGGGVVSSPTLFGYGSGRTGIMGEAGTEAVMPLMRGSNGKLGVASAGGGRSVNISYSPTIHVDARTDQAQVAQIAIDVNQRGQRQLLDHLHAAGVV